MKYAPVLIPTLCRSEHFITLVESLKNNSWAKYTPVYVGLDYPPSEKYRKGWKDICNYVENGDFSQFASFKVLKRNENYGAVRNTNDLINHVKYNYDIYIYCEDDLEVSPNFLEYMDKCLAMFENDPNVIGVTGYSYPLDWYVSEGATCFKQSFNASMWGAGFWRDKIEVVHEYINSGKLLKDIRFVIQRKMYLQMIDACISEYIPAATSMFPKRYTLLNTPSDISIRAYLAVMNKYFVSPIISKVRNHGFDGSGLYCQNIDSNIENGSNAMTYIYSRQTIDDNEMFTLNINKYDTNNKINRNLLNIFDARSSDLMKETWRKLWIAKHLGVWVAKLYSLWGMSKSIFARTSVSKNINK